MNTILYCWNWGYGGNFLCSRPFIRSHHGCVGIIYFRTGRDFLFDSNPTYFNSLEEATAAAEEMGFTVMPNPPEPV